MSTGTESCCVNGHPFTPENTHHTRNGRRKCRTCARLLKARYRAQTKRHTICTKCGTKLASDNRGPLCSPCQETGFIKRFMGGERPAWR